MNNFFVANVFHCQSPFKDNSAKIQKRFETTKFLALSEMLKSHIFSQEFL